MPALLYSRVCATSVGGPVHRQQLKYRPHCPLGTEAGRNCPPIEARTISGSPPSPQDDSLVPPWRRTTVWIPENSVSEGDPGATRCPDHIMLGVDALVLLEHVTNGQAHDVRRLQCHHVSPPLVRDCL